MTNEEMKEMLVNGGATVADVEKAQERFDADKITEIVEAANSPKEAFENLHAFYPELEVEKLQEQCDFIMEQVEASLKEEKSTEPMELTEDELENVAGGGFWGSVGNWFKKNWKTVAIVAAGVVIGAVTCGAGGAGLAAMYVGATTALKVGCAVGLGALGGVADGLISHEVATEK